MGIFKKIFSKDTDKPIDFSEGDIFYTHVKGEYHLHKLLVFEKDFDCYHVLGYKPLATLPGVKDIDGLKVSIYHYPVDKNGFKDAKLLTRSEVMAKDLIGYHEYLRQTQEPEYYFTIANEYYLTAFTLTDQNMFNDAIDSYSKAIDLVPDFFEAIDNRAFCKMNLALWTAAIDDFEESLKINPGSLLAEFSIGECYLNLKNYQKAKEQFEKAILIDPNEQAPKDFLKKVNELMEKREE